MDRPAIDDEHRATPPGERWRVDLQLTVWAAEDGWHARLSGIGTSPREFVSPFELARYVTWPLTDTAREAGTGLR